MRFILPVVFIILCVACRSEQSADPKPHGFADYFVRYLQVERQIKAHASFHQGDTLRNARPITFEKGIQFQGNPMEARQLESNTVRYIYNGVGDYATEGFVFEYKSPNDGTQKYTLQMAPIEAFSIKGVPSSAGITIAWKGAPLQANESLVTLFSNRKNEAFFLEFKGATTTSEITIPPAQLTTLTPGKNLLYLVKKQTNVAKEGNIDITSQVEFYSKTIEVQILK